MRNTTVVISSLMIALFSGCTLKEIRSKSKFGSELRHSGTKNTNKERWAVQQGLEFKWEKGVTTGFSYRRRDESSGDGDNDNGMFFDLSFPVWKAEPKPDESAVRIRLLERRLAALERQQPAPADGGTLATQGNDQVTVQHRGDSSHPGDSPPNYSNYANYSN